MPDEDKLVRPAKVVYVGGDPAQKPVYYVNSVQFSMGIFDVHRVNRIIDTTDEDARVVNHATIIMSPQHAKSMATILNRNLALYEQQFGPIPGDEMTASAEVQ